MTSLEAIEMALIIAKTCQPQIMCCGCPFYDARYECYIKLVSRPRGVEVLQKAYKEEQALNKQEVK